MLDRPRRGSPRHFCATPCRHSYDSASRQLGRYVADRKLPAPCQLRTWSQKARALPGGVKSDEEVPDAVTAVPARPERPKAAPYNFVQHGLFWYVTDPQGLRIGDPIKTPQQAKRLARRMSKGVGTVPDKPCRPPGP